MSELVSGDYSYPTSCKINLKHIGLEEIFGETEICPITVQYFIVHTLDKFHICQHDGD